MLYTQLGLMLHTPIPSQRSPYPKGEVHLHGEHVVVERDQIEAELVHVRERPVDAQLLRGENEPIRGLVPSTSQSEASGAKTDWVHRFAAQQSAQELSKLRANQIGKHVQCTLAALIVIGWEKRHGPHLQFLLAQQTFPRHEEDVEFLPEAG